MSRRRGPRDQRGSCRERGFTLTELAVAAGVFSLVLYLILAATSLFRSTFLSDQLSLATQNALLLGSWLEEDLLRAVRDPETGDALVPDSGPDRVSISFYRANLTPGQSGLSVVPVRWTLTADPATKAGHLVRTIWDASSGAWDVKAFKSIWLPMPGYPGNPPNASPIGLRVDGDTVTTVQTVLVTVLARIGGVSGPGTEQDRVTIMIHSGMPPWSMHAAQFYKPLKKLAEIPTP